MTNPKDNFETLILIIAIAAFAFVSNKLKRIGKDG